MRVLLAAFDIFGKKMGAGQRFFTSLIEANPDIAYVTFYKGTHPPRVPANCLLAQLTDIHRKKRGRKKRGKINLRAISFSPPRLCRADKSDDVALLLDAASLVAGQHVDRVEIPYDMPYGALLPEALKFHSVSFDKIVFSMRGARSITIYDDMADDAGGLSSLTAQEHSLYGFSDIRYGIERDYTDRRLKAAGGRLISSMYNTFTATSSPMPAP